MLDAVADAFELLVDCKGYVNCIVHYLIVGFDVHGRDLLIGIKQMLEEIAARDSEKASVIVFNSLRYVS